VIIPPFVFKIQIDMNIKLNIKSIIKFEQFTNKSFNEIDYTNADDLLKLMYCIVLSNNPEVFTYEEFLELIKSKKISKTISDKFNKEIKLIELFSNNEIKDEVVEEQQPEREKTYIKDIAAILVVNAGLDINFVMNEMSINDISLYMEAYNNSVKQQMESSRLWTYLTLLPNLDSKVNSPVKLYPFPWELEAQVEQDKTELKSMADELPDIFKSSADLIEKINKQKQQ
jgi:hypothetical protein